MQERLAGRSALLQRFLQRLAGVLDVRAKQFAGPSDVTLAAEVENLVVLFVGASDPVCEIQLQTGVALPAVVHIADDVHGVRALGA